MTLLMTTTNTWTLAIADLCNCDTFIIYILSSFKLTRPGIIKTMTE